MFQINLVPKTPIPCRPCLAEELILRGLEDAHAMKRTVWDMKRRQSGLGGYASAGMAKATLPVVVFSF